jgi:hypothetical protein
MVQLISFSRPWCLGFYERLSISSCQEAKGRHPLVFRNPGFPAASTQVRLNLVAADHPPGNWYDTMTGRLDLFKLSQLPNRCRSLPSFMSRGLKPAGHQHRMRPLLPPAFCPSSRLSRVPCPKALAHLRQVCLALVMSQCRLLSEVAFQSLSLALFTAWVFLSEGGEKA